LNLEWLINEDSYLYNIYITFITLAQIKIQKKHSLPPLHASHPTDYTQIKVKRLELRGRGFRNIWFCLNRNYLPGFLFVLNAAWITNSTGFGKAFVDAVSGLSDFHDRIEAQASCIKVWYNHFYSFLQTTVMVRYTKNLQKASKNMET